MQCLWRRIQKLLHVIRENLAFTKLAEDGKLLNMDVLQALRSLEGKGVFDIIFYGSPHIIMNWKDRCWNI